MTNIYLPHVRGKPQPEREWDPRLDVRGCILQPVQTQPGEWYLRLVKARWYNEEESGGRHHIYMDILDPNGERKVGQEIRIYWDGGSTTIVTEEKPGEEWAANFAMYATAPAYGVLPQPSDVADLVLGCGLGSIEQPAYSIHTSYGFTWQWTKG